MTHFALICPPFFSHIKVFEALSLSMTARGHRATFLLNAGGDGFVSDGFSVCTVDGGGPGDIASVIRRAARPNGPLGILRTVADTAALTDALCRDGPALLEAIGADAVIGDQMEPAAGLVAAYLGLPFASIACALPVNAAPGVPLPFLGWPYDASPEGLKRNRGGERVARLLLARQGKTIEGWSERFGVGRRSSLEDCLSTELQLAQTVPSFDFPRSAMAHVHPVGPIRRKGEAERPLPAGFDPAKPLVFASLGTLQGHRLGIFRKIAEACRRLGAELAVAHCGGLTKAEAASIDAALVTDFLPQAAMLARADVCVTHGGLNTVLDALEAGVPLLTIPIAFDQPGVAARIVHHGAGLSLSRVLLSSRRIEASLARLLAAASYRSAAARIGREISTSGGADLAAELIDTMMLVRSGARR